MNTMQMNCAAAPEAPAAATVELKLEVAVIPVADFDRAKRFYGDTLGWRLDADITWGDGSRVAQFTPPGSPGSIHFGTAGTAAPGSATLFLVVSDIEAAHAALAGRGVAVSEIFHRTAKDSHVSGPDPERRSYASFAAFRDPDGNTWLLQEVTARLPGRVDGNDTRFSSSNDLAAALRRAETAHGEHEKTLGHRDADWPIWYADYMTGEQAGKPQA